MRTARAVAVTAALSSLACSGQLTTTEAAAEWQLVADESGGLVDPRHPELGSYPNPRGVAEMAITVRKTGEVCADAGDRAWCGGPIQGIPYNTSAFVERGALCLRVVDVFGNGVAVRCGIAPVGDGASCIDTRARSGAPCQICTDTAGNVVSNTCDGSGAYDEFAESPADCANAEAAIALGARLFADSFNAGLLRAGLDLAIEPTGAIAPTMSLADGDVPITEGCAGVLEHLDDEFSDDHDGTDDYVFGPEAMEECANEGRCRIGQLVTRAMAEACAAIPTGCDTHTVEMAVVGSGGEAVETVCDDEGAQFALVGDKEAITTCVGSPIVIDLDGDGLVMRGPRAGAQFPLMGSPMMSTGWITGGGDALLARDLDGNGRITSGYELFGEATGGWAPDGFAAMRRLDRNGDGAITSDDPGFETLVIWRDDGDAVSDPGEVLPLASTGIERIDLGARENDETDAAGNVVGLSSSATTSDGRTVPVHDVWFRIGSE